MKHIYRFVTTGMQVLAGVILVVSFSALPAAGMGMDLGSGSDLTTDTACTPDENPVIVPGVLGSPMRIHPSGTDRFIVADYNERAIFEVGRDSSVVPQELFSVKGKPLSVVKMSGRKSSTYFVANDDTKTIDRYVERRGKIVKRRSLFRRTPVQALDMVVDENAGTIYLVDGLASEVKVIKAGGRLVNSFGGFGQLVRPKGIALDVANQEIVVTDYGDSKVGISASIQVFDLSGVHLATITGKFSRPQGLTVSHGKIYVADAVLGQILVFDRDSGGFAGSYGCFGTSEGHLLMPMDVSLGSAAQNLYVADNRNGRITVLPLTP